MERVMSKTLTLGDALPAEIKRVQGIRDQYAETAALVGHPSNRGVLLSMRVMQVEIDAAVKAMAEGDTIAMMRCYQSLKNYSD